MYVGMYARMYLCTYGCMHVCEYVYRSTHTPIVLDAVPTLDLPFINPV